MRPSTPPATEPTPIAVTTTDAASTAVPPATPPTETYPPPPVCAAKAEFTVDSILFEVTAAAPALGEGFFVRSWTSDGDEGLQLWSQSGRRR